MSLEDRMNFASSGRAGSYDSPNQKLLVIILAIGMLIPVVNIAVFFTVMPLYIWLSVRRQREQQRERLEQDRRAALERGEDY